MSNNSKSPAWGLFEKSGKKAKCLLCDTSFALPGGSTSSILKHLKARHKAEFEAYIQKEETSINTKFDPMQARRLLAEVVCTANLPFNICRNKKFREFCLYLNRSFPTTSDETIKRIIMNNAEEYYEKMKFDLNGRKNLVICTDGWASPTDIGTIYVLYVFYVTDSFERRQCLLGVSHIDEASTASNIGSCLCSILEKVGLDLAHVVSSVSDGGANVVAMANQNKLMLYECGCHKIQLVFKEICANQKMEMIICKARTVARLLKTNSCEKDTFYQNAALLKIKSSIPRNFSDTRWAGSQMLLSAYYSHVCFNYGKIRTLGSSKTLQKYLPTTKEIKTLNSFLEIGTLLHRSILQLETDGSFASEVIPTFQLMINELSKINTPVARCTQRIIKKRLKSYEDKDHMVMTVFVDPRYSYVPGFCGSYSWEDVEKMVCRFSEELHLGASEETTTTSEKEANNTKKDLSSMEKLIMEKLSGSSANAKEDLELTDEICLYRADLMTNRPPLSTNPLNFWQINHSKLPGLSAIAKILLSAPSSSACSERTFSLCGDIVRNSKRNRMKKETLNSVLLNIALSKNNRWTESFNEETSEDELEEDEDRDYDEEFVQLCRKRKLNVRVSRTERETEDLEEGNSKEKRKKNDQESDQAYTKERTASIAEIEEPTSEKFDKPAMNVVNEFGTTSETNDEIGSSSSLAEVERAPEGGQEKKNETSDDSENESDDCEEWRDKGDASSDSDESDVERVGRRRGSRNP